MTARCSVHIKELIFLSPLTNIPIYQKVPNVTECLFNITWLLLELVQVASRCGIGITSLWNRQKHVHLCYLDSRPYLCISCDCWILHTDYIPNIESVEFMSDNLVGQDRCWTVQTVTQTSNEQQYPEDINNYLGYHEPFTMCTYIAKASFLKSPKRYVRMTCF